MKQHNKDTKNSEIVEEMKAHK